MHEKAVFETSRAMVANGQLRDEPIEKIEALFASVVEYAASLKESLDNPVDSELTARTRALLDAGGLAHCELSEVERTIRTLLDGISILEKSNGMLRKRFDEMAEGSRSLIAAYDASLRRQGMEMPEVVQ